VNKTYSRSVICSDTTNLLFVLFQITSLWAAMRPFSKASPLPHSPRIASGLLPPVGIMILMYKAKIYRLCYIRNPRTVGPGHTREKPGRSLEGEIQRTPGLIIDLIVVPRRTQACRPNGLSLYARWLFLRTNFTASLESRIPRSGVRLLCYLSV
jgi:hypothetical protein